MSSITYVTSIPIFKGVQGNFYVVDGYKYHTRFPIEWALDHKAWITGKRREFREVSGPKECRNCREYGSIRGVFVGYCGNCVKNYALVEHWRGNPMGGWNINDLSSQDIHEMYPYMIGVEKTKIGDEEEEKEECEWSKDNRDNFHISD